MNIKIFIYLFPCLFICSFSVYSQFDVSGRVLDRDHEPLDLINILVFDGANDQNPIKGSLTDKKGSFILTLNEGEYILKVNGLGYSEIVKNIKVIEDLSLPSFILNSTPEVLNTVVLKSKKKIIERKVDRLVFNVENSVSAIGNSGMEVLKITPGVKIYNNQISLVGKQGNLQVMVDNRILRLNGEALSNYLASLSADNIKKIEVITNPPAKYEAEGNSGILNIILKTSKKNQWRANITSTYTQYTYPYYSIAANLGFNREKISFRGMISLRDGAKLIEYRNKLFYTDQTWIEKNPTKMNYNNLMNLSFGLKYDWTNNFYTEIQLNGNNSEYHQENNNDVVEIRSGVSQVLDSIIRTRAKSLEENDLLALNFNSEYALDSLDKVIGLNIDYFNYENQNNRIFRMRRFYRNTNYIPNSYSEGQNNGIQEINNFSISLDSKLPFDNFILNFGGKLSYSRTNNSLEYFNEINSNISDKLQSNKFLYDENVQSVYTSAVFEINKNLKTKIGFRYEYTKTKGESIEMQQINRNNYGKVFPSFYIIYNSNESQSYSLSYNKRISRPSFEFLNPFRIVRNNYSYIEGNPFLQPAYTNNFEFNFTADDNWSNTVYLSMANDLFYQIALIDESTRVRRIVPENYYDALSLGVREYYSFSPLLDRLESTNSIDIYYYHNDSYLDEVQMNTWQYGAYLSTYNTLSLNSKNTLFIGSTFWWVTKTNGELYDLPQYNELSVSFKALLFNKKLTLNIQANDIFRSSTMEDRAISNGILQTYRNYYDFRNFKVSLRYQFGSKKVNIRNKKFGNEDEKNRL